MPGDIRLRLQCARFAESKFMERCLVVGPSLSRRCAPGPAGSDNGSTRPSPRAAAPLRNQVLRANLQSEGLETSHYHVPDTLLRMLVKVGAHLLPHVG